MLPYNQLPDTPWISVDAAIAWIALRYACPIQEWNALPAWEMQHPGLGCAREIVDDTLKAAGRDLVNAVTKGRITAWESGQWEVGKRDPNAPAQQLPKEAFAESLTTALAGFLGWSTQGRNYPGPFFPQTRFTVPELRGVWPPARTKSPPAPVHIDDLPADWSLLEAIAWIMFRDTGIVQQAASEQPRDATGYWSKNQFRDEKPILKLLSGKVGLSPISLMIMFAARASEEASTTILNYEEAETALLNQLRTGRIAATGLRNSVTECREMTTADWRGKILPYAGSFDPPNTPMTKEAMEWDRWMDTSEGTYADPLDNELIRMAHLLANMNPHQLIAWPQHAGPVWHSLFLSKSSMVEIWPPAGADVRARNAQLMTEHPPSIVATGAPGRPSRMRRIVPEHTRRIAAGLAEKILAQEVRVLARWLTETHPDAPCPTEKTISNNIRRSHRPYASRCPTPGPKI